MSDMVQKYLSEAQRLGAEIDTSSMTDSEYIELCEEIAAMFSARADAKLEEMADE